MNQEKPDFYIPLSEAELRVLARCSKEFLDNILGRTTIIWSSSKVLSLFLSKISTVNYLQSIGILTPKTYTNANNLDESNFPLIVKPDQGSGSKKIFICRNVTELDAALVFVDNPIIQEFIPGDENEYTVGVYSKKGSQTKVVQFRRNLAGEGFTSWCEVVKFEKVEDICKHIAIDLQLDGSINIQLKEKDGLFYVFEVNPRFSSTVNIRSKIGFKDVAWSIGNFDSYDAFNPTEKLGNSFVVYNSNRQLS